MKILISIAFLFLCSSIISQDLDFEINQFYAGKRPLMLGPKTDSILEKEYQFYHQLNIDSIPENLKWVYYLGLSNLNLFLKKDSATWYFNNAIKSNPKATCSSLLSGEKLFKQLRQEDRGPESSNWILTDLPAETIKVFRKNCKNYYNESPAVADNRVRTELENRLISNDQPGRKVKKVDWKRQNILDAENRKILDSLYAIHQSFSSFNKFEQNAFSSVLHHSDDCAWNKKWVRIWMDEMQKGNVVGGHLFGSAISRMFEPKKGVCWQRDPNQIKIFINNLKKNYPAEYAERFGYDYY